MVVSRKQLKALLDELERLKSKSDQQGRMLIDNGEEVPEEHRQYSKGVSSGYAYALLRLRMITGIWEGNSCA